MILTYAVILERVTIYDDDPTPEHAALIKELRDPVEHLERLVAGI